MGVRKAGMGERKTVDHQSFFLLHSHLPNVAAMSTVKVLFFASCREAVGKEALPSIYSSVQHHILYILLHACIFEGLEHTEVTIPSDMTAAQCDTRWLMQEIVTTYPDLEPFVPTVKLAVNKKYIRYNVEVKAGDEVALIPPISGG